MQFSKNIEKQVKLYTFALAAKGHTYYHYRDYDTHMYGCFMETPHFTGTTENLCEYPMNCIEGMSQQESYIGHVLCVYVRVSSGNLS